MCDGDEGLQTGDYEPCHAEQPLQRIPPAPHFRTPGTVIEKHMPPPCGNVVVACGTLICLSLLPAFIAAECVEMNCTMEERRTLSNDTGFPRCIRVGIIQPGTTGNDYFARDLPRRVFETAFNVPGVKIDCVENSRLDYTPGVVAVAEGLFDVFIGDIYVLGKRIELVDFTLPYSTEEIGLLYLKTNGDSKSAFFAFFAPLHWSTWVALGGTAVLVGFVIFFTEATHHSSRGKANEDNEYDNPLVHWTHRDGTTEEPRYSAADILANLSRCVAHGVRAVVSGVTDRPVSIPGQMVSWFMGFLTIIVMSSYTANLVSSLTYAPVTGLRERDELLQAGVIAQDSTEVTKAMVYAVSETVPNARKKVVQSRNAGYALLSNSSFSGNESVVLAEFELDSIVRVHCDAAWSKLGLRADNAFPVNRHSALAPVKRRIDQGILLQQSLGAVKRWVAARQPASTCAAQSTLSFRVIKLDNMWGIFTLTGASCAATLFLCLFWRLMEAVRCREALTRKMANPCCG